MSLLKVLCDFYFSAYAQEHRHQQEKEAARGSILLAAKRMAECSPGEGTLETDAVLQIVRAIYPEIPEAHYELFKATLEAMDAVEAVKTKPSAIKIVK